MAARDGMANIILALRAFAQASTSEYTLGSETYFTDDHLEDVLDRHRRDVFFYPLVAEARVNTAGNAQYFDFYFEGGYWEEANGGTAVWLIQDGTGAHIGTASYTVDYAAGFVRFTTDTQGTASYYLTGRKYDLNRAIAYVWRQKAANVANRVDFESDNHMFKASQLAEHYLKMASQYEREAGASFRRLTRSDVNA